MKKTILVLITVTIALISNSSYAQQKIEAQKYIKESTLEQQRSYRIDPQPLLEKYYKKHGFDPAKVEISKSLYKANYDFSIGTPKTWWAIDFKTEQPVSVSTTCRAIGDHCYIFVEDAIWGTNVTQSSVAVVVNAFDKSTPADPNKGIYQTDVENFGSPMNVDGDLKIIIIIMDITDNYGGPGTGYTAGYFTSINESLTDPNSNKGEIYYIDGVQSDLNTPYGLETAMSTTAHEFQHMIHFNYIKAATTFFNESFSLTAEIICGYPVYDPERYAAEPNIWLQTWRRDDNVKVLTDYSRGARFGLYLLEQFGAPFFTKYLSNKKDGVFGIGNAITAVGGNKNYFTLLPDWFLANYLNDKSVNPAWGYNYTNLPKMAATVFTNPNTNYSGTMSNHAAKYFSFTAGKNLLINFNNNGKYAVKVRAIKYGNGAPVVESVTANSNYSVPDFGTTYDKVDFVVYLVDDANGDVQYNYSFTSSGVSENKTFELQYDEADTKASLGAFTLSANDTIAVFFDGVAGTKLDSIVVGLRNDKQITGKVYRTKTSATRPGQSISNPFILTGTSEPVKPFPVPWPNMAKVDFTNQSIDASSNFCVVFPYQGADGNNIIITERSPSEYFHSLTYLNNPSSGNLPGWYYLSVSDNSVGVYVIRAYVRLTTGVKETVELLPSAFSLDQNYPNPFNPSTIISYNLPKAGNVQIKIFDALGREIRSLINEEKNAGKYNILWDSRDNYGSKVSSGVYFYSITSGDFVQTKKMVLMK